MTARAEDRLSHATAEAVARRSYGKLVAFLAARTRDVAAAEDALAEAFAAAVRNLLRAPDERRRMSLVAVQVAARDHGLDVAARRLDEILDALVEPAVA